MAFEDTPAMRATILDALRVLMAGPPPRGVVAIANNLQRARAITGSGRVSHDTIDRFHKGEDISTSRLESLYVYLVYRRKIFDPSLQFSDRPGADPVFDMFVHQFAVRDRNLEFCTLLEGTFSLYFASEDVPDNVVIGAISFSRNPASAAFEVAEFQGSTTPRRVERWTGYYFHRDNRFVLVMRGEGVLLRSMPKFYVLNTPHADESDRVTEIGGRMLKLGSGASPHAGGAFSAKVVLRRNPDAFEQCEVVPRSGITDPNILSEIDP